MLEFLLDDIFEVERLDPDGKKFDKGMSMNVKKLSLFGFIKGCCQSFGWLLTSVFSSE